MRVFVPVVLNEMASGQVQAPLWDCAATTKLGAWDRVLANTDYGGKSRKARMRKLRALGFRLWEGELTLVPSHAELG